jgi:hypothetical protein
MTEVAEVSVTIKRRESERYAQDAPWYVVRGTVRGVRKALADSFGLNEDDSLPDLVAQAERSWKGIDPNKVKPLSKGLAPADDAPTPEQAVENVVKGLDGEVIDDDDPWFSARGEPEPDQGLGAGEVKEDGLLVAIQKAESKAALRTLHAANVELFKQDKYKDALRARAKEVS